MEELEMQLDDPIDDPIDVPNAGNEPDELPAEDDTTKAAVNDAKIDLDAYAKGYTGHGLMNRMLFIADMCPSLKFDALRILVDYVTKNTMNVAMLNSAYARIDQARQMGQTTGAEKIPPLESWNGWIEQTTAKAQNQLEIRLADFKRQKDEAVKESIRRSLDELFHQYLHMGKLQDALKLYARGMREYCSGPNYVLQMLISWINATVYAENWAKLATLIPQAERAISEIADREAGPGNRAAQGGGVGLSGRELASSKAKIKAITGLCQMMKKDYKTAAESLIGVDIDALDYPETLTANDVAVYGALCALATFSRAELKTRLMTSALFRRFLESEPKLVEMLQKFCRSEFGACFDILHEMQGVLLLNIYLSPHVITLFEKILQSAIVQYFQPYLSISIKTMANEFRITPAKMESYLVTLIDNGSLSGRIDSFHQILYAKFRNSREEVLKRTLDTCKELNHRVDAILVRAALVNHKVIVGRGEGKKAAGGGGGKAGVQKRKGPAIPGARVPDDEDGDEDEDDDEEDEDADVIMDIE